MSEHPHQHADASREPSFWRSPTGIAFSVFAAIAAVYLVFEHSAHLIRWLPFGLLLLCPLLHLFMHGGHGAHGGQDGRKPR